LSFNEFLVEQNLLLNCLDKKNFFFQYGFNKNLRLELKYLELLDSEDLVNLVVVAKVVPVVAGLVSSVERAGSPGQTPLSRLDGFPFCNLFLES
jgi:hypothetical protein